MEIYHWYDILILGLYGFFLLFIFFYSIAQFDLVLRYWRSFKRPEERIVGGSELPIVTVQLPVYNERYVVERLIDSVVALDYPKALLEVQVLDDSTDETSSIIAKKVAVLKGQGVDIIHLQRPERTGFKAGALAYGTELAKGGFIAIFDADFKPRPDFLQQLVGEFDDRKVGMVQTRWEHLNEGYNVLTSLQAFGLNAHFTVEQGGRNAGGSYINFNGTAGIWRKQAILDAGGWSSDTLTEDLDLSYRAQLKGWKFVFREDVGAPAELPAEMNALKTQQYRWTKGAAECTIKNLKKVLTAPVDIRTKLHAFFHLMNSFIFISVFGAAVLSVPVLFVKHRLAESTELVAIGSLFVVSVLLLMVFYATSYRRLGGGWGGYLLRFFPFLSMSMGMSLHNAVAVAEGYMGRKTPFVRTPKFNIVDRDGGWISNVYRVRRVSPMAVVEILLGLVFLWAAWMGVRLGDVGLLPFHLLLFLGFFSVGVLSVKHAFKG